MRRSDGLLARALGRRAASRQPLDDRRRSEPAAAAHRLQAVVQVGALNDWLRLPSVVISRLQEIDSTLHGAIHEPVFLRDSARPDAGSKTAQRLRFADAHKGVAQDRLHKIQDAQRDPAVRLQPPT